MRLGHISIGKKAPDEVIAVVEIPKGSKKKYELDLKTGKFRVSRTLPKGVEFPVNYGFIPQTLDDDGDALDVLVLTKKLKQGTKIKVNPIALMQVLDNGTQDDKIIAVPRAGSKGNLTALKSKIGYFFKAYKEGIIIKGWLGRSRAYKEIRYCMQKYRRKFKNVL